MLCLTFHLSVLISSVLFSSVVFPLKAVLRGGCPDLSAVWQRDLKLCAHGPLWRANPLDHFIGDLLPF